MNEASASARPYLERQLDLGWQLTRYHLESLTTAECLWRPAERGLHVHRQADGSWHADWPEHEGYDLGPASSPQRGQSRSHKRRAHRLRQR